MTKKKFDFLVITQVVHKQNGEGIYAYSPYVKEMNIWFKHVNNILVIAPIESKLPGSIDIAYEGNITFWAVPTLNFASAKSIIKSVISLGLISFKIFSGMQRSEHIHLRCPGNMGFLGSMIQAFFPNKKKTAKYAGNWDWNSRQPLSYRLQQQILRNIQFTKNIQVLVYGDWKETLNIKPFFTASYSENLAQSIITKELSSEETVRCLFVGTLSSGKNPLMTVQTSEKLLLKGYKVQLDIYGEGEQREVLTHYIEKQNLLPHINLHGNVTQEKLISAYQEAHFLLFASKSEGWPKAVAESMFWGCVPVTTAVSCVPEMVDYGTRGVLVNEDADTMVTAVVGLVEDNAKYLAMVKNGQEWSRQFTLERFEAEITQLL